MLLDSQTHSSSRTLIAAVQSASTRYVRIIGDFDGKGIQSFPAQFSGLWKYISDWQNVYKHFDRDRSGSIDSNELADALRQFGYNLSPQLLNLIERKYGASFSPFVGLCPFTYLPTPCGVDVHKANDVAPTHPGGFAPSGGQMGISFDRFVRACVVVKQLTEAFQRLDTDRDGWIRLQYETFMQTVLSLP